MKNPRDDFWRLRLEAVGLALEKNRFEVHQAPSAEAAKALVLSTIIPACAPESISWGGSMTFAETGLYHALKASDAHTIIDTFDKSIPREQLVERRRQALLSDLFITGCNAVTEMGQLVNLDMIGNRVAAMTFGPRNVIILVGRNKIVPDVAHAMTRIRNFVAPANIQRLGFKTPCLKTGRCEDCRAPERICNHWTISEKSFPKHRIKVILINQDIGL